MAFTKDAVQRLLRRADIVTVVRHYLPQLRQRSGNKSEWRMKCPFHTEQSPSFTVTAQKQFYHCYGCGAHGKAIKFVMEYCGLSFIDAVLEVARICRIQIPQGKTRMSGKRLRDKAKKVRKLRAAQHKRQNAEWWAARMRQGEVNLSGSEGNSDDDDPFREDS